MSSTATQTQIDTSTLRARVAVDTDRESKESEIRTFPEPPVLEGKYGRYYAPVQEPNEMKKIVSESATLELGLAAVLLQIAHAAVGKGVSAHSSFTYRRIERARRSIVYIYAMTFGTPEEKRIITDATHRAHSHVKGKDYDANDVDAQLWVAATMYWSMIESYEMVFGKLDQVRADTVYREFSVMATALRVPPEKWPRDREAFKVYWDDMIANLEVTDEAKAIAQDLFNQTGLPYGWTWLYATIKGPFTSVLTIEMLPERIRNEFGIPSTLYTRHAFKVITATNSLVIPWLPTSIREFPMNYYMADMRRRIAAGSRL